MTRGRILDGLTLIVGLAMFAYHMLSTQYLLAGAYEHQDIHLAFVLVLVFLAGMSRVKSLWLWTVNGLLIVAAIASCMYVLVFMTHLEETVGFPAPMDVVVGVALIVLVVEATRQAWGWTLPIVCWAFMAYFFLGDLIPGPLYHTPFTFGYIISSLAIGLSGIFGTFLSVSANMVFLFVVFGALMEVTKINDFFLETGKFFGRFLRGGPGQVAVTSSCLVGMVTGAAVANVAITGAFTIPYMKRVGYSAEQAGAIEAAASSGGQIMPPVMGAGAFLMAFFLGVPYSTVMVAAVLPAVFFYLALALGVQFMATSNDIVPAVERVNVRLILRRLPLFLIPLTLIIVLLLLRYSPMRAGFWAVTSAIGLSVLFADTRPTLSTLARSLAGGAVTGAKIGASLAAVGLISQTLIATDLGTKITGLVEVISQGNLVVALLITMVVSLILGCGVPTVAAYGIVAIVVVPSLMRMGVLDISAHMFSFYFAIISALTPPVAMAALAGAAIAGGNYFKTSLLGFKLAISGFIIPYLIVFNPILVLHVVNWPWAIGSLVAIPVALASLTAFIFNCGVLPFTRSERWLSLAIAGSGFGYCLFRRIESIPVEYPMLAVSLVLSVVLVRMQLRRRHGAPARPGLPTMAAKGESDDGRSHY